MAEKILLVDDDPNILQAYMRSLRKTFELKTAEGGAKGIQAMSEHGPFAVVVSDLRMPKMDGIQFLSQVRERSPDTVRMMLTGNADLDASIDAVNEGNVFRFLTKPCPPETLIQALNAGIKQYKLVIAERELVEKTLSGSVKVLTEILSLTSPAAYGRAARVMKIMRQLAEALQIKDRWEFELAGMLSQTGCVTLPTNVIRKIYAGETLNTLESRMFEQHPKLGSDLIANIPRLEGVAEIIEYQAKDYNGGGFPQSGKEGEGIPIGARALHIALDFDAIVWSGQPNEDALATMKKRSGRYDVKIIKALAGIILTGVRYEKRTVKIVSLLSDMLLAEDVRSTSGLLLVAKGQAVTPSLKARLMNFARMGEASREVKVLIPIPAAAVGG